MSKKGQTILSVLLVYGLALLCLTAFCAMSGCISSKQWRTFTSHAAETGIATLGGAAAVMTGGTAGIAIAGAGMAAGALVGEMQKPPPDVLEARTDKDGNTTYRYVEPKSSSHKESFMPEFSFSMLKWVIVFALGWAAIKALLGPRYRYLVAGFLADAVRALGCVLKLAPAKAVKHAKSAGKKAAQAAGMKHSR